MALWLFLLGCLLLLLVPCRAGEGDSGAPAGPFVRVSPRDSRYFELTDGRPYIPIGLNMINPRSTPAEVPERTEQGLAVMDEWMGRLSEQDGNFIRVWLGRQFWDVEHQRSGRYDEERARRIDGLLELARRHGIRVKMTLEYFREIDPESDYWAAKPVHHVSRGGPADSIADWFDGPAGRRQFRSKLRWYAGRYGDRPQVFGWELWNEVNTVRGGDYMAWTEAMLSELQRLFPRNLCMQSLGSFDTAAKRELYRRLSRMEGNDVAQVHRYLDPGAELPICHGPVDVLAADAVRELRSFEPGRPVLLAESGAVRPSHTGPSELYEKDSAGIILHDVIFAPFFAGAAGCGQSWHWGNYVDANDLWWQFGRFAEVVDGIDPPAEDFEPTTVEHDRLRVYLLPGRNTALAWCRDRRNDWKSELRDGRAPEAVEGAAVELGGHLPEPPVVVRAYDPWADRWTEPDRDGAAVQLPPFKRSIVLRVERRRAP